VDFAAPRGTPIKATADGKIVYMGYKGGYGNAIMLNHGGSYRTLYGHMMCFARGLHNGSIVHQNQVIGYVGSTGLASGPHVHYEVLVNGVHRNPLTVPLPASRPIAASYRAEFFSKTRALMAKLAAYK
jgi:murein DD-endopeptidase MepM/ murein hydrolase activator NlpD